MFLTKLGWRHSVLNDQGYLIVAVNSPDCDYVSCARLLARSLKKWHEHAVVCLLTDKNLPVDRDFDIVKTLPYGDLRTDDNPYANDWQCYPASPFHETIKLEADMLVAQPIDHYWSALRHQDIVVSTGALDFKNKLTECGRYRSIIHKNNLPDTYNAFVYWRTSKHAKKFFVTVKKLFDNWSEAMSALKYAQNEPPNTDLAYSIATLLCDAERCTLPTDLSPRIVHMKSDIAKTPTEWYKSLTWEIDQGQVRVNGYTQSALWHYHHKELAEQFKTYYE